jgi:hypothetical protein
MFWKKTVSGYQIDTEGFCPPPWGRDLKASTSTGYPPETRDERAVDGALELPQLEEGTTSMLWKLKTLNLRTTPAREGEQTYDTEAAFESVVKDAQAEPMTRIVSATFPDGTVLDENELGERPG